MAVLHYRELIAWQKAMDLASTVYEITRAFPKEELYGLVAQVRRAVISIPSNIAEGQGRGVGAEFKHHLRIANGSRQEVETQLLLAARLGYVSESLIVPALALGEEVGRLIAGLHRSLTGN